MIPDLIPCGSETPVQFLLYLVLSFSIILLCMECCTYRHQNRGETGPLCVKLREEKLGLSF